MKINRTIAKKFIRDAIIACVYWTIALTPYMFLVVQVNMAQYIAWVSMQGLVVPPLGAISAVLFRWVDKKWAC